MIARANFCEGGKKKKKKEKGMEKGVKKSAKLASGRDRSNSTVALLTIAFPFSRENEM
jgi:hypothetical protein